MASTLPPSAPPPSAVWEPKKVEKWRDYYKKHHHHHAHFHPEGDVGVAEAATDNWCFIFFFIIVLVVIVLFVVSFSSWWWWWPPPPPPPPVKRSGSRTACLAGEIYNATLRTCAPILNAPLAFDASLMDRTTAACTDFYKSMCGTWIAQHTVVDGEPDRLFSFAQQRNEMIVKSIVASPSSGPLNEMYHSCVTAGSPASEKESIIEYHHLEQMIVNIVRSHADLPVALGRLSRYGFTTPWVLSIERHPTRPIMVPLFAYDDTFDSIDEHYVMQTFQRARHVTGDDIVKQTHRIQSVVKMIRTLRERQGVVGDGLSSVTNFTDFVMHRLQLKQFGESLPQEWNVRYGHTVRGWIPFFHALDGNALRFDHDQDIWLMNKDFFTWFFTTGIAQFDVLEWQAYIEFSILFNGYQAPPALVNETYHRRHDTWGPLGPGGRLYHRIRRDMSVATLTAMPNRESFCLKLVQQMLPGTLSRAFDDLSSDQHREEVVHEMVVGLKDSLARMFPAALGKLNETLIVVGSSSFHAAPGMARISKDRYDHNMRLIREARVSRNLALWHKDIPNSLDRNALSYFALPATETVPFASNPTNTFHVPSTLLMDPFYSDRFNKVSRFAVLGTILAREMVHLLDPQWSADGSYDPTTRASSAITSGCAGIAATVAYDALFHNEPSVTAADKQHFFMVTAQTYCASLNSTTHYDVNRAFRSMSSFQRAFGCVPGTSMYESATCT